MTRRFGPETENLDAGGGNILAELRGAPAGEAAPETLPAAPRKRISPQTLILALVLVASVAAIWTMRKQGMAAGVGFTEIKAINYEPEKLKPEDITKRQQVMAELARSAVGAALDEQPLLKNPFRMALAAPNPVGTPDAPVARREDEIRAALAQLTVTSIMQGTVPLARINGKTVKVSDMIDGLFMVTEIGDRSVSLAAEGKIYTVPLSDTPGRRSMPTPPSRR